MTSRTFRATALGVLWAGAVALGLLSCRGPVSNDAPPVLAPVISAEDQARQAARAKAVQAILDYGGFLQFDKDGNVSKISLVYTEDEWGNRIECRGTSDEILAQLPNFPETKELLLQGAQATDRGMQYVAQLTNLEILLMWNAQVSDAGTAALGNLRLLKMIHISQSQIGDATLETLSHLKALEGMSLQGNQFTDAGLKHLEGMTQVTNLWIGMSKVKITDAGVAHLAGLVKLQTLEFQDSAVTDSGIMQLRDLKSLKDLFLGESKVTKEGAKKLEEAIPGLRIIRR